MSTIRLFFCLAFAGLVTTAPVVAQDQKRDWQLSGFVGWYSHTSTILGPTVLYLDIKTDAITNFYGNPSTWIKIQGRFEKLDRNHFIFMPGNVTDEKGTGHSITKEWCNHLKIELTEHPYDPMMQPRIRFNYYLSEADARSNKNRCGESSYSPIYSPTLKPFK
jgi:hypothetical protein